MTTSEIDLCDRLRDWAERLGFEVYPEVSGWDLVLVATEPRTLGRYGLDVAPGEQVGIHAKLRANCDVLVQALPPHVDYPNNTHGPTWPLVAVPVAGNGFRFVAARLGIGVIEATPATGDVVRDPRVTENPRRSQGKPLHLPPVASRVIAAGAPSPRQLSPWRVKALNFLAFARRRATFTVTDLAGFGLSKSWAQSWGQPSEWTSEIRRGKAVRVRTYTLTTNREQLPDFGYADVAAELAAADAARAGAA